MADPSRRAAVLGRPIVHSLSPLLHRAAYAELGLDWEYTAIECGVEELPGVLAERADWAGFSCTMPLKRAVLSVADEIRPVARAVRAANTLLPRPGGGWIADNTDVAGMVAALAENVVYPQTMTIIGAGGTAQAAVAAGAVSGVRECSVLVRDLTRTHQLRETADAMGVWLQFAAMTPGARELGADLIVSTVPTGAADPLAGYEWRPDQAVLDVIYDPWPSPLATAAAARGAKVLSGALMLLHQAAAQVELMTGQEAPVPAMRAALYAAAPGCGV